MSFLKTAFRISTQNFRKWQTDYRMWIIAVFIITMTLIYVDDLKDVSDYYGFDMSVWIFPFLYTQFYNKVLFTLPVVLMFCDAPFTDRNQLFIMMRTSRTRWLCGQLLYIILASGFYYLFIFIASVLSTIIHGDFSLEWGSLITALSYDSALIFEVMEAHFFSFSQVVVDYFTPLLACFYTFVLSWLSAIFLGLVVFVCNLFTDSKVWGIAVCSLLIILTIPARGRYLWDRFSPISWSTLDQVDVGGLTTHPSIVYCLCVYAVLIITLTALIFIFGKKKSLDMKGD